MTENENIMILRNKSMNQKEYEGTGTKSSYLMLKRGFDIISSALGMIVLLPVFLITAFAIFLEDRHHSIFSQTRVGKDGKEFKMYKFRSMCIDAEEKLACLKDKNEADGPAFKIAKDPRITVVGKFIRKTSIDELPQLWNILKGDMSVVGPRPPLPSEVESYNDYHMQRLSVKPGLTCYWQCSGRSALGFEEWMALDMKYIEERSVLTDMKIILRTVPAVLFGKGAC